MDSLGWRLLLDRGARITVALPFVVFGLAKLATGERVAREVDRSARAFGIPWQVTHGLWGALPVLEVILGFVLLFDRRLTRWAAMCSLVAVSGFTWLLVYLRSKYGITECGCGFDWAGSSSYPVWIGRNVIMAIASCWLLLNPDLRGLQPRRLGATSGT